MNKLYFGVALVSLLASAPAMAQSAQSLGVGAGVVAGRATSTSVVLGNGVAGSATSQQALGAGEGAAATGLGSANPTTAVGVGAAQQNQFAGTIASGRIGGATTTTSGAQLGLGVGFGANNRR
jgi:hypothetical protein